MPTASHEKPLLLDTHYWIWLQEGKADQISPSLRNSIDHAAGAGSLLLSIISVWEVALLESRGRIGLSAPCEEWVEQALATPGLSLAPLTPEIAIESTRLPEAFHGDPADRIIFATARKMGARLMTRDEQMRKVAVKHGVPVL